ncbi:DUF3231 family protein [Virgibacillus byunsanensis]|uniref:DUF3231 family protein n=1 Tax=Virgibacillus byunsanensis TaxID=570945 RepID=A0ABW3LKJ3_9BACI
MVMEQKINVTSAELSQIWEAYMDASITSTVLSYFIEKVEDEDIKPVLHDAQSLAISHMQTLSIIFEQENKPIPFGFTDEDVNIEAPRLYSDNYFLQYMLQVGKFGLLFFSRAITMSTREDINSFFSEGLRQFNDLHRKATVVGLRKGLYIKPPTIPTR